MDTTTMTAPVQQKVRMGAKALRELYRSLDGFAHAMRPAELIEEERARYAAMTYTWAAESFRKHVADVAEDLRRKAAEIERLAAAAPATAEEYLVQQAVPFGRENMATDAAAQALHLVMWMAANLNLDGLVSKAAEVDAKARQSKRGAK